MANSALALNEPKVFRLAPRHSSSDQLGLALAAPEGPNLTDADRTEAERRYGVIEPLIHPERYSLLTVQYKSRAELVAYLMKAHDATRRTIYRWLAAWKKGGLPALVSKDRKDKGKARVFNPAALEFILAAALPRKGAYGALSVQDIFRAYEEERVWRAAHVGRVMGDFEQSKYARYIGDDGLLRETALLPKASYNTVRNWFNRVPEIARTMAREGDEAYRNSQEILSFRAIGDVQPLDYVVMDHRRLDIFCLFPERGGWKLARPWLTAAIDMRTRKWLAWVIVETPSSDSIAAVLKRTFIDFGLPRACYWDNGKDFRCEWFEGKAARTTEARAVKELGGAWRGVLGTLGVRVHHAIVHNARAKLIEPNFGRISNFDRTLPEWCGHQPGARPERFDALIDQHERWLVGAVENTPFRTSAQVAALYTAAIEDLNERELQGEGMQKATPSGRGWRCPNEAWELLIDRVERRTVEASALHFCFAKRRELKVQHGEICTTHLGRKYHYRMIGNPVELMAVNGQTVEIAYDPTDLGEIAVYLMGRLLGLAHCAELRRMGETAFVEDERLRRAARREVKKFITAVHDVVAVPTPEERLARRAAVAPVRGNATRPEMPVELPAEIVEADAARTADRNFRFDEAAGSVAATPSASSPAEDDGEFNFFQGD